MDPELAAPADRVRPLGGGRWELTAVIDDECRRGLERLKGLLSHVDPHLTLGQIMARLVGEGLDRPGPAAARAKGAEQTSAPKTRRLGRDGGRCAGCPAAADPTSAAKVAERPAAPSRRRSSEMSGWRRDRGRYRYVDRTSGRRCAPNTCCRSITSCRILRSTRRGADRNRYAYARVVR